MKPKTYYATYLNAGPIPGIIVLQQSCVWRLDRARHLVNDNGKISGKDLWEVKRNADVVGKCNEYKILKINISCNKIVYVLVGCMLSVWFEIALSQSKEKLEIWKDLNMVKQM